MERPSILILILSFCKVGPERKPFTNLCNIRLTIGRVQLELGNLLHRHTKIDKAIKKYSIFVINLVNGKLSDFVTFKQMIIFGAATFAFKSWYLDFKGSSKSFRFNFLLWEHLYLSSFTLFLSTYVFRSIAPAPRPRLHMHVFLT